MGNHFVVARITGAQKIIRIQRITIATQLGLINIGINRQQPKPRCGFHEIAGICHPITIAVMRLFVFPPGALMTNFVLALIKLRCLPCNCMVISRVAINGIFRGGSEVNRLAIRRFIINIMGTRKKTLLTE